MGTFWSLILIRNLSLLLAVYTGCFMVSGLSLYVGGNSSSPHFDIPTSISLIALHVDTLLHIFSVSTRLPVMYAASSANVAPRTCMKLGLLVQPMGTCNDG